MRFPDLFPGWKALRRLLQDGGVYVETALVYPAQAPVYRGYFRTTLQLDGNLLNFLPDPERFPDDPAWAALYRQQAQAHQQQVAGEIWQHLNALHAQARRIVQLLGALSGLAGMAFWPWDSFWLYLGGLALAGALGALLFHFLLRPLLLAWLRHWLGKVL